MGGDVIKDSELIVVTYKKEEDVCINKLDSNGISLFFNKYEIEARQTPKQIIKTPDGGYMIAGMEGVLTNDTVKAYALKIDSMGNYEWDKRYLMGNDARFFSVQHTPWDGGYIFGGMGYFTTTGYDMFVVKTLANGDTLWTKRYGSTKNDCDAKIVLLTTYEEYLNGAPIEYLMTGCWESNVPDPLYGFVDYLYISKLDENGNIIWERNYTSAAKWLLLQTLPIIKEDKSFVGTAFFLTNDYTPSTKVIKFNPDGNIIWQRNYTLDPDKHCYLKDLQPTPDGGYVLAGYQYSSPQTAWVLKIDSLGNTCSYVGCDSTVVVEVLPGIPSNANPKISALVYPVPASTHLFIRYQIPAAAVQSGGAVWRLYNALGSQWAQAELPGNAGTVAVETGNLPRRQTPMPS